MSFWLFLLKRRRFRKEYRETRDALRALDVNARNDIGVNWLGISAVARQAALRNAG